MLARHIIVLNGKVIGGWRNVVKKDEVTIEPKLLGPLTEAQRDALHSAAERYAGFVGLPVTVRARR